MPSTSTVTSPKVVTEASKGLQAKRLSTLNGTETMLQQNGSNQNIETKNLQSRYEKLMNFSYNKQLDEIKDNLQRLEKEKS
jgi:ElaB/YqjD/DUF883 family membrane-anchored ribosome-binding protein